MKNPTPFYATFSSLDCFFSFSLHKISKKPFENDGLSQTQEVKRPMSSFEVTERTTGAHVVVKSLYKNNSELFDNADSAPDMQFMVPGMKKPLALHKVIMATTSDFVRQLLKPKQTHKNKDSATRKWEFDANTEVDRRALEKVLRFCYGFEMDVGTKDGECSAVIAALCQLDVTCAEEIVAQLSNFAVEEARKDLVVGVELLKAIGHHQECCTQRCTLDKRLTPIVLTAKNIKEHFDLVVNNCLMMIPAKYLDVTEYGEAHTKYSEFHVRVQYVKTHKEEMETEEKQDVMMRCDWTKLESAELKELDELGFVNPHKMVSIYHTVLVKTEKERDEEMAKNKKEQSAKAIVKKNPEETPANETRL